MIKCFFVGFVCFALGLYAGKRRAGGECWTKIARALFDDTRCFILDLFQRLSNPFRKGRAQGSAT